MQEARLNLDQLKKLEDPGFTLEDSERMHLPFQITPGIPNEFAVDLFKAALPEELVEIFTEMAAEISVEHPWSGFEFGKKMDQRRAQYSFALFARNALAPDTE